MSKSTNKLLSKILLYVAIVFSLFAPLAYILPIGSLKDLRFLAPLLVLPFFFKKLQTDKLEINKYYKSLFILFFTSIVYTILLSAFFYESGLTYRNTVNIVFIISPLIFAWGLIKYCQINVLKKIIAMYFVIFTTIYIVTLIKQGISLNSLLGIFSSNLIVVSDLESESPLSLVMGFYYLYFLHKNNYKVAAVAAIFTLLGGKRIAIFGILVCTVIYFFVPLKATISNRKKIGILTVVSGILIIFIWDSIFSGSITYLISLYLGIPADRFFMGRLSRFDLVFSNIESNPILGLGYGVGYIENLLYYKLNYITAFHNDFYRLYLEFGAIIFAAWLYISGKYSAYSRLAFSVTILLIILMQTDNVFIYDRVMYSYYLIFGYALINQQRKNNI